MMLESTTNFINESYEVGMLCSEQDQNYRTTTAQPWVTFTIGSEDSKKTQTLKKVMQPSIDTNVGWGFVKILY